MFSNCSKVRGVPVINGAPAGASQKGFTLMEVLIAVSITAVIGLGVWQVLAGVSSARERVDAVAEEFDGLQQTFLLLERDLRQMVNRPIRNIYGDFEPALSSRSSDFALVLTRQGWRNPLGSRRSELQRSAWEFTGDDVRRRYWVMLDQGQEEDSREVVVLTRVTEFTVRFLDNENNWNENWPPDNLGTPTGTTNAVPVMPVPTAIEVTVVHERFGELNRLFLMPDFDTLAVQTAIAQPDQPEQGDDQDEQSGDSDDQSTGDDG